MKILIYGINYSPELTGIGKYSGEMAKWMYAQGYETRVITAPPYYPEWKVSSKYSSWKYSKFSDDETIYRCPLYVPQKPTTIKRLVHLLSFSLTSLFPLFIQYRWKPDYIICVAPTLFCVPGAWLLSKLTGAKTILHIQDYEVDAMLGLGMAKKGFLSDFGKRFERWCLHSMNMVSTISQSMINKAVEKGVDKEKLIFFPNWSEVERFRNITKVDAIYLKGRLGLSHAERIILYSGNIGEKQGLEILIEVAERMRSESCVFLIVGDGGGKERLQKLVEEKKLANVIFRPLQAYEDLPFLLKLADCHLVVQRRGAADAVLPSKLTNILAVGGNSVITAELDTELGRLCENYPGIGICVEPESVDALFHGIIECLKLEPENKVAKAYALEFLDKGSVLNKFINDIQN
ncbi:colanic acid biosynthesis glycosyl transferase WcaI [Serratia fonticola]|jgi:colanic acid biosynthesis glycosyl transferase WcaI|uniref:Colanic acid biosynthesis glycosyl transferase WcaI n=1 Tax=Serratia fonticola TaxID=47917 RepID=A0A542BMI4_SERFO|nr:glycosyltransferase WbuB [Serratia fonticola]TQI79816.1 colanic acid biosynthesis glycosyl transferase WcaI [Serratia fonticola]TQI98159.1 colanic acid biosynthesis glycosyl transferase WcaI [Serratia fonticola]TVZ67687.1 colanic acid biosynthesis glycosyl transferase WcaI [Serratia fonticola]